MTDTERLDFILTYFRTEDIGDEESVPGVVINNEELEEDLSFGKPHGKWNTRKSHYKQWNDDLRDIIDRAIESHNHRLTCRAKTTPASEAGVICTGG